MDHRILIDSDLTGEVPREQAALITQAITSALQAEGVELPCEVDVLLTDDEGIREINREMRGLDRPTDVLSFPMFRLAAGDKPAAEWADPETGLVPLGDMAISLERAAAQGEEYGHGLRRELCYLTVHSVLHLLGYDHVDEGEDKRLMRRREEEILARPELMGQKQEKQGG